MTVARKLPPLNALRAFEAAGRLGSFAAAAEELHVTPAAISHQVKALEEQLGVELFRRLTRSIVLTKAGETLLPGISDGLDRIHESVTQTLSKDRAVPLRVTTGPAFAGNWLIPRIKEFRDAHPEIEIHIDATERLVDLSAEGLDVGIRYGPGDYPRLRVDCLLNDEVFPVCSPALCSNERPLVQPTDLRYHTLLHIDDPTVLQTWPDWSTWLATVGVTDIDTDRGPRFGKLGLAIQAAVAHQGVTLANAALVGEELRQKRLARPFKVSIPVNFRYWLVSPPNVAGEPRVQLFREWIIDALGRRKA